MRRWARARRKAAADLAWARERGQDLAFARASWRAFAPKESQES